MEVIIAQDAADMGVIGYLQQLKLLFGKAAVLRHETNTSLSNV